MKKILSIALLLGTALLYTGCVNEEDDLFSQSAAERLNQATIDYTERLINTPAGWAIEYYPTPDVLSPDDDNAPMARGYLLLGKFVKGGSVDMGMNISGTDFVKNNYIDQNIFGKYVSDKSTWDVITDNGPVLSFNSYNKCMHIFSDPAIFKTGSGLEGDYEFTIISLPEEGNTSMLKGKKRGTYVRMTKLDADTDFEEYTADINRFTDKYFTSLSPNSNIMRIGDAMYKIEKASTGIMNIYPYDGDNVANEDFYPYLITRHEGKYYLRFRDVIAKEGVEGDIQEFVFDETTERFTDVENEANIIEGGLPAPFFTECLNTGKSWRWVRDTPMSDYMKAMNDKIYEQFKSNTYTLSNINFTKNESGDVVCTMPFTFKMDRLTVSGSAIYVFSVVEETESGITLQYKEAGNESASTLLGNVPVLSEFINQLSTTYTIEAQTTRFDMRTLRLTAADDASRWFVVTLFN